MKTKNMKMNRTKTAVGIFTAVLLLGVGGVWAAKNTDKFQPKTDDSASQQSQTQLVPLPNHDPFRDMIQLQKEMERLFGNMLNPYSGYPAFDAVVLDQNIEQAMDLRETDKNYIVEMDLPGLEKSDIQVEVVDQVLSVSGECKKTVEQKDGEKVLVQERSLSSFDREFVLPGKVNVDSVTAEYKAGVLTITLPKTEQQKSSHVITVK